MNNNFSERLDLYLRPEIVSLSLATILIAIYIKLNIFDLKRNILLMLLLAIFILSSIRKYFRYKYFGYSKYGLRRYIFS
jgi:hypothetical protein